MEGQGRPHWHVKGRTHRYLGTDSRTGNRQCQGHVNLYRSSFPGMAGDGFKRGEESWGPWVQKTHVAMFCCKAEQRNKGAGVKGGEDFDFVFVLRWEKSRKSIRSNRVQNMPDVRDGKWLCEGEGGCSISGQWGRQGVCCKLGPRGGGVSRSPLWTGLVYLTEAENRAFRQGRSMKQSARTAGKWMD